MWFTVVIETVFSIGLFINAALFIPQAVKLFRFKNPQGLSLITFVGFNFIQLFTIFHGYIHQDYLLMIGYILSFITCGSVSLMIIVLKLKQRK
ncbi:MAG TPA: PQ-loop domain-containing transporter [Gammaproteobacteria bacterium]|jgi:MtN3 and saliva related transmembrane protein|nr:PQ-loop domain-containing transporter [Gammaproteobacteria bacterium]